MPSLSSLADQLLALLQGEPLRVIGYGAAVIVYLVAKITVLPDVSFETAVLDALAAAAIVGTVVESFRHMVYSPATVAAIVNTKLTAEGPIAAAEAVGVDTTPPAS